MKQCRKCGAAFDGKACKVCASRNSRRWAKAHPERVRAAKIRYRGKHRADVLERERAQYAEKRARFPEYLCWKQMCNRCFNPNNHKYSRYGARGITVCDEWRGEGGFQRFLDHIGRRPGPEYSIDRIDNDGNYEPGNVRWATPDVQRRNNGHIRLMSAGGETMCMADWASSVGMQDSTLRRRLDRDGMPLEEAIATPVRSQFRMISYRGETHSAAEWSVILGGTASIVSRRIHDGWSEEDAVAAPLGVTRAKWNRMKEAAA